MRFRDLLESNAIGYVIIDGEYIDIIKSKHSTEDRHGMSRQRNITDKQLVKIINDAAPKLERRKKNYIRTIVGHQHVGIVLSVKSFDSIIVTIMIQHKDKKPPFRNQSNVIEV